MKNVIKMFVAIAVMGVMSVSAFAQGAGPGGAKGAQAGGKQGGPGGGGMRRGGGGNRDAEVLAKLNLTDGQKAKVKALKEATQKKVQELMKSMGGPGGPGGPGTPPGKGGGKPGAGAGGGKGGGNFAGMREKFKPIMEGYTAGIKGILTPPQYTAYEKGMKEMAAKMKAERAAGGGPGGPGGKGAGKGKGTPPPTP